MNDDRLPTSVYWRRRFVVLGIPIVLVLALGLWAINRAAPPTVARSTAPATTPATTSAPPTSGVPNCAPPALAVTIAVDAATVAAGVSPTFTITISNAGNTQCVVDAGELHREVVIVSGTDRIWSSKDCAPADSSARSLLLAPAASDTTQIAWNRVRSAPGCPAGQAAAKAGTYQVSVTLAGTSGGPVVFRLG